MIESELQSLFWRIIILWSSYYRIWPKLDDDEKVYLTFHEAIVLIWSPSSFFTWHPMWLSRSKCMIWVIIWEALIFMIILSQLFNVSWLLGITLQSCLLEERRSSKNILRLRLKHMFKVDLLANVRHLRILLPCVNTYHDVIYCLLLLKQH